jgi:hypothetical protein
LGAVPSRSAAAAPVNACAFETLKVRKEGAVLYADTPSHESLGPALVRDLVSSFSSRSRQPQGAVFSADPDYFIPHVDVTKIKEYRHEEADWRRSIALLFRHLSASRLVTIAQIEGRVARAASSCWRAICAAARSRQFSLSRNPHSVSFPVEAAFNISCASWAAGGRSRSC